MSNVAKAAALVTMLTKLLEEAAKTGDDISDEDMERSKRLMEESHEEWEEFRNEEGD